MGQELNISHSLPLGMLSERPLAPGLDDMGYRHMVLINPLPNSPIAAVLLTVTDHGRLSCLSNEFSDDRLEHGSANAVFVKLVPCDGQSETDAAPLAESDDMLREAERVPMNGLRRTLHKLDIHSVNCHPMAEDSEELQYIRQHTDVTENPMPLQIFYGQVGNKKKRTLIDEDGISPWKELSPAQRLFETVRKLEAANLLDSTICAQIEKHVLGIDRELAIAGKPDSVIEGDKVREIALEPITKKSRGKK